MLWEQRQTGIYFTGKSYYLNLPSMCNYSKSVCIVHVHKYLFRIMTTAVTIFIF